MTERTYSRRVFLQAAGLLMGSLVLIPPFINRKAGGQLEARIGAAGKKYKGTNDGRVLESVDGGKTWQQVANFGSQCAIQSLSNRQGQLQAWIGIEGYRFSLTSTDARIWYTA